MWRTTDVYSAVGVDLAGVPTRPTGVCLLCGSRAKTRLLHTDEEIMSFVEAANPHLVAIDAPLSLPPGRRTIHERGKVHLRPCDAELLRRGIKFFPITLGSMRLLTRRGIALKGKLESMGYRVVEVYPGGAQDVWGIPRKQQGLHRLRAALVRMGVKGLTRWLSDHELDAVTAALVAQWFLKGKAEVLGNFEDGAIVMPHV